MHTVQSIAFFFLFFFELSGCFIAEKLSIVSVKLRNGLGVDSRGTCITSWMLIVLQDSGVQKLTCSCNRLANRFQYNVLPCYLKQQQMSFLFFLFYSPSVVRSHAVLDIWCQTQWLKLLYMINCCCHGRKKCHVIKIVQCILCCDHTVCTLLFFSLSELSTGWGASNTLDLSWGI